VLVQVAPVNARLPPRLGLQASRVAYYARAVDPLPTDTTDTPTVQHCPRCRHD